ncbi:hypothetical protein BDZ45DRAFT_501676 [Acephala macrosclerotiorum]|nr:hypothetical protein BDZ45DRAFT_501676 [Acephala macrosclerotiorum]
MTNLKRSRNTYWCDVLAGGSVGFHARVGQRYRTSDPYANAAAMHGIAKRDNKRLQAESRNCSPSLTRWLPVSYTRYMKRLRPPKRPPNSAQSLQISQTKIYCHKHQRTANTKEQNWSSIHLQPWLAHTRTGTGCCAGITGPHGAPPARKLHAVLDAGNKIISLTLSSVFSEPGQLTSSAYEVVMESGPCARGNIKGKEARTVSALHALSVHVLHRVSNSSRYRKDAAVWLVPASFLSAPAEKIPILFPAFSWHHPISIILWVPPGLPVEKQKKRPTPSSQLGNEAASVTSYTVDSPQHDP